MTTVVAPAAGDIRLAEPRRRWVLAAAALSALTIGSITAPAQAVSGQQALADRG